MFFRSSLGFSRVWVSLFVRLCSCARGRVCHRVWVYLYCYTYVFVCVCVAYMCVRFNRTVLTSYIQYVSASKSARFFSLKLFSLLVSTNIRCKSTSKVSKRLANTSRSSIWQSWKTSATAEILKTLNGQMLDCNKSRSSVFTRNSIWEPH